jgi:hypothetical protein
VAQICLANKYDALKLVQEMKEVANEEKMEFIDGSKETARGLDIIDYKDPGRSIGRSGSAARIGPKRA